MRDAGGDHTSIPEPLLPFTVTRPPRGPRGHCLAVSLLALCCGLTCASTAFEGSCYDDYKIIPTTCTDVLKYCSSSTCTANEDGTRIIYSCEDPIFCNGSFTYPDSSSLEALSFTSCGEAWGNFTDLGCSNFECAEDNKKAEAECFAPFAYSISNEQRGEMRAPVMTDEDYTTIYVVFFVTALVFAATVAVVACYCFRGNLVEPSVREIVEQRMTPITYCLYTVLLAPLVKEDGSTLGIVEYLCKLGPFVGIPDCEARNDGRVRCQKCVRLLSALIVASSVGALFGTIAHNSESMVHTLEYERDGCFYCRTMCGTEDLGCDGCLCKPRSSCNASTYSCTPMSAPDSVYLSECMKLRAASVPVTGASYLVMAVLTTAMSNANFVVISTPKAGSKRLQYLHGATLCVSLGLLIFAIAYSNTFAEDLNYPSEMEDQSTLRLIPPEVRRALSILWTTLAGLVYEQLFF
ncbi:hypothetical protein PHYPSEUDO_008316 [Phytophthora pseudosyringae]|uniref:Transmembrane protein n=1 Tax=Phytophthora pseudosyringae TaxID=221518 RepID=A0A8T1VHL4_9STRA|nr:hypothetical protein PHYPSEUDO_008316 [Phytophthora pseudosyringae]